MAKKLQSGTSTNPEYQAFANLLGRIVRVPHSEIKAKLDAEKQEKKEKRPKISDASRASRDKD